MSARFTTWFHSRRHPRPFDWRIEPLEPRTLLAFGPVGPELRGHVTPGRLAPFPQPAVAADADGHFVVAFTDETHDGSNWVHDVYARRYSAAGEPRGDEFRVNTGTAGNQHSPAVAMDADGDFVVAWSSYVEGGTGSGVFVRRYDDAGDPVGEPFLVDAYRRTAPAVVMGPQGQFIVISGGTGRAFSATGEPLGGGFPVRGNSASVAMDADGEFVVAWNVVERDEWGYFVRGDVYAQRYTAGGQAVGPELRVNATTPAGDTPARVAVDPDGDFLVTWDDTYFTGAATGPSDVYARLYRADGQPVGADFRVNAETSGWHVSPAVATDADGTFLVVWHATASDGGSRGVYARRYGDSGSPGGGAFRVSTAPTFWSHTSVASNARGDFIVAWVRNETGVEPDIHVRRYGNTPAARATSAFVGGTGWAPSFREAVSAPGTGDAAFGYEVPTGAGQIGVLPWSNINRISVRFSGPVVALARHLLLPAPDTTDYTVTDFEYADATNTATWTLDRPLPRGVVAVRLDASGGGITDAAGLRLDGEWADAQSWVSGDGSPGGDFLFRLNVLPGDANRDGRVAAIDYGQTRAGFGRSTGDAGTAPRHYTVFRDVNGSGTITAADLGVIRGALGSVLPAPAGTLAGGAITRDVFREVGILD
jgi:hypothetical protein